MQNPFGNNNQNNQDFFNNLPIPPNYAKIKNDEGEMRIAKVGFSWTVFLFGPFPALFRNDWYNFFLMIVLDLDYVLVGDYYIPDLQLPEESRPIGIWGRMHKAYLELYHPARYADLILSGQLWTYLADLNEQAQNRLDCIIAQMKEAEGITEELKS